MRHLHNFVTQFYDVYTENPEFLSPLNELEVPKFLPTFLRPTYLEFQVIHFDSFGKKLNINK